MSEPHATITSRHSLRVWHVGPCSLPIPPPLGGAIERRMWNLARAQVALGADVTIVAGPRFGSEAVPPTPGDPSRVATGTTRRLPHAIRVAQLVHRSPPDVLHLHSRPEIGNLVKATGYSGLVAQSFDFPLLYPRLMQGLSSGYHLGLGRLLEHSTDLFLPVSDYATRSLGALAVRLPAGRTRILWNGVESDSPDMRDNSKPVEREQRCALFVGRFVPQKGSDAFAAAATRLPAWRFVTIGPHGSFAPASAVAAVGPTRANLVHRGALPDAEVRTAMKRATCLVLPTREWEVFGMVLIEALSLGTPVVTTRAGGPPEILRGCPAVHFFEPGDLEGLVAAIEAAATTPDREREAARTFCRRFTWPMIAEASLVHYRARGIPT